MLLLSLACIALYCFSAVAIWRYSRGRGWPGLGHGRTQTIAGIALIAHGLVLYGSIFAGAGATMSLGVGISMAGWTSVLLYLAISTIRKTVDLGMIVLPLGALSALAGVLSNQPAVALDTISSTAGWHIFFAIPTYGVLCVAFAQACLLVIQDHQLHKPSPSDLLSELPAIQTMESNLYWLTLVGFILMSANAVIGMASNAGDSGVLLEFNHHILLSMLAWAGFGGLLLGRKLAGWRGRSAAVWTIATFLVLVLAYFGTRFVNDFLLSN